ncbi:MAG TPA: hypothetical protein VGV63_06245 [Acidimicrobiales bacterium]|nr:hypothetical protein [Acidimicrobiales bacterium]
MAARGGDLVADFAWPEPVPAPVTTIAWRLAQLIVGVFASRNAIHLGGPAADYQTWGDTADAATALAQLDVAYDRWSAAFAGSAQKGSNAQSIGPR